MALHSNRVNPIKSLVRFIIKWLFLTAAVISILILARYYFLRKHEDAEQSGMRQIVAEAKALTKEGQYDKALVAYNKIIKRDPSNLDVLNMLGILSAQTGDTEKAFEYFQRALKASPLSEKTYYNMGNLYLSQKKADKAIYCYKRSIDLKKDYLPPHLMLAKIYGITGEKSEALKEYREMARIDREQQDLLAADMKAGSPDQVRYKKYLEGRAFFNEGFILEQEGNYDKAFDKYSMAMEAVPDFALAYFRRGLVLFRLDHRKEAEADLRQALKLKPDMRLIEGALGDMLFRSGETDQARDIFQRLASDFPKNLLIKDYLGGIYLTEQNFAAAERVYKEALEIDSNYSRAHEGLGNACLNLNRLDEAEVHYRKAISLSPQAPDPYYNLACLYSRKGDQQVSMKWLTESLKKGFKDIELIKTDPDLKKLRETEIFKEANL